MANDNITDLFSSAESSVLNNYPGFAEELREVLEYYQFYDGYNINDKKGQHPYGQMWQTSDDKMDYVPTKEIRNHAKKLLKKQSRFMFGAHPDILVNTSNTVETSKEGRKILTDKAEAKRTLLDSIFQKNNFWSKTANAFLDATIGKRVLLMVHANPGEEVRFTYYTMPEFVYEVDPADSSKLKKVTIVYQDERTRGQNSAAQLWHKYTYEIAPKRERSEDNLEATRIEGEKEEMTCWYTYQLTNGDNEQIVVAKDGETTKIVSKGEEKSVELVDELTGETEKVILEVIERVDTELSQIPCFVILNEGLTGDIYGNSDIKDLMQIANNYNRTVSDYRDALRFKMFEQPVFVDASNASMKGLKIAPNAAINLKTDARRTMGQNSGSVMAQVTTLSSNFNFVEGTEKYLDRAKKDMYEIMDQPLPEKLQDAPSAKAMRFLFFDLMARCEEKWNTWEPAIVWVVQFLEEAITKFGLYSENDGATLFSTETMITLRHNYPIPEDTDAQRDIAIKEVESNVKSHKTYIREYGDVEDEDAEFEEILEELASIDESGTGAYMATIDKELALNDPEEPEEVTQNDPTKEELGNEEKSKGTKGTKAQTGEEI